MHGLNLAKTDLKKMEKLTKINIHLHGNSSCCCIGTPWASASLYRRLTSRVASFDESLVKSFLLFLSFVVLVISCRMRAPQPCSPRWNSARWRKLGPSSKTTRSTLTGNTRKISVAIVPGRSLFCAPGARVNRLRLGVFKTDCLSRCTSPARQLAA